MAPPPPSRLYVRDTLGPSPPLIRFVVVLSSRDTQRGKRQLLPFPSASGSGTNRLHAGNNSSIPKDRAPRLGRLNRNVLCIYDVAATATATPPLKTHLKGGDVTQDPDSVTKMSQASTVASLPSDCVWWEEQEEGRHQRQDETETGSASISGLIDPNQAQGPAAAETLGLVLASYFHGVLWQLNHALTLRRPFLTIHSSTGSSGFCLFYFTLKRKLRYHCVYCIASITYPLQPCCRLSINSSSSTCTLNPLDDIMPYTDRSSSELISPASVRNASNSTAFCPGQCRNAW